MVTTTRRCFEFHICRAELGADRVRDHCYLNDKFRVAAHNASIHRWNIIAVIFSQLPEATMPTSLWKTKELHMEKLEISISIAGSPGFPDLPLFMNAASAKLLSNLTKEGDCKFHNRKCYIKESKVPLLLRIGRGLPYEYVDEYGENVIIRLVFKSAKL